MLFTKKKVKVFYKSYWERMLGYNFETEFAIYNYLCEQKIKRKTLKKIPSNKRFDTYFAWESHVKSLYCNAPLGELREFHKYLNHKNRGIDNQRNLSNNIILPIMLIILSVVVIPLIYDIAKTHDIINNYEWISVFVRDVILVIISVAKFYFIIGFTIWLINVASKSFTNTKQEEVYYVDYMKIINEIIEVKEIQRKDLSHKNST